MATMTNELGVALGVDDEAFCPGCDDWVKGTASCKRCGEQACGDHRRPHDHKCKSLTKARWGAR